MSKYIKVDDLQAYCDNQIMHEITPNEFQRMNHIEVVQCKDCKHFHVDFCKNREWETTPEWFCADGKRKCGEEYEVELHEYRDTDVTAMDNIIEATEYCLTKGKCTDCKFSKGKMFSTCRYLVEDMSKLLKERKKGKWILQPSNKEQGEQDFIWWECSECGQVIYSRSEHDRKEYHKYYGRCGSLMY